MGKLDFAIIIIGLILGMMMGRIIISNWKTQVNNKVDEVLSRVIMIDVPQIDKEVSLFLTENEYRQKYLTAIDLSDLSYGIYEIKDNDVTAYAHGKCLSVGDASVGTYKVIETKSHLDYHDARYWNVVRLEEIDTKEELIVSTPPYKIAEAPIDLSEVDELGGIEIGSESMLSVYDNGDKGILLLVVDSKGGLHAN